MEAFLKPEILNKLHKIGKTAFGRKIIVKLAAFAACVGVVATLTGSVYFRSNVFINDNGVTTEAKTNLTEAYEILEEQGISVTEFDSVKITWNDKNTYIDIERAFDVYVTADGKQTTVPVLGGTVEDALEQAGITLGEFDELNYAKSALVTAGMEIKVIRVEYKEREETVTVPYETEYVDNTNKKIGYEETLVNGSDGENLNVWQDKYVDGELADSKLVSETAVREVVNEKIEVGTACAVPYAKMDDASALKLIDGVPEDYTRIVSGKATAYSARAGAKTASGRSAVVGTVAVNPNVIPYGSELYIVSQDRKHVYGYAIAADTGLGMMEGTVAVDLFCANYADSCRWGAHYVDIFVITEGNG